MFVFASSRLAAYLSFAPSAAQVFDDDGMTRGIPTIGILTSEREATV
jgi:hypothetical protein